ncbi:MAG: substrate-binding domain-containing protein, partial [Bacteroidota bacterium]
QKNGLEPDNNYIVQTDLGRMQTEEVMKNLLALNDPPTAIIAFNDYVALDAIRYVRKQGLQINKDIFFVSYANLPITSYMDYPPLVSVEQFPYQQAEKATDILFRLISSKGDDDSIPRKIILESKVVINNPEL